MIIPKIEKDGYIAYNVPYQYALDNGLISQEEFSIIEKGIKKSSGIASLNQNRTIETKQITVELSNGAILNGDETSQSRISRAVLGLPDNETEIPWIDASGEAVMLTKPDLQEALTLAGAKQTEIFTKYAQLKAEL